MWFTHFIQSMIQSHADEQPAEDRCASDPVHVDEAVDDDRNLDGHGDRGIRVDPSPVDSERSGAADEDQEADEPRISDVARRPDDQVVRVCVVLGASRGSCHVVPWADTEGRMGVDELPAVLSVDVPESQGVLR
jgi:hypothetical protein